MTTSPGHYWNPIRGKRYGVTNSLRTNRIAQARKTVSVQKRFVGVAFDGHEVARRVHGLVEILVSPDVIAGQKSPHALVETAVLAVYVLHHAVVASRLVLASVRVKVQMTYRRTHPQTCRQTSVYLASDSHATSSILLDSLAELETGFKYRNRHLEYRRRRETETDIFHFGFKPST